MKAIVKAVAISAAALAAACQTTRIPPSNIPASVRGFFAECTPRDGTGEVSVLRHAKIRGEAVFDWLANDTGKVGIEVNDPIGGALVGLVWEGASARVYGAHAKRLPSLSVTPDGYINADGEFTGIHPQELGCLLDSRLPAAWQDNLVRVKSEGENWATLTFVEDRRLIDVAYTRTELLEGAHSEKLCIDVSWGRMLGLVRIHLKWCMILAPNARTRSFVELPDGYQLELVTKASR